MRAQAEANWLPALLAPEGTRRCSVFAYHVEAAGPRPQNRGASIGSIIFERGRDNDERELFDIWHLRTSGASLAPWKVSASSQLM